MIKKRGFTLVELLVVISIIALLLAILMPALSKVRSQATRVVCSSYLHSWGIALSLYAIDNKNYFPYNSVAIPPDIPVGTFSLNWCGTVVQQFWKKYLLKSDNAILNKKKNILYCPTMKAAGAPYDVINSGQAGFFLLPHGYDQNPSLDYTARGRNPDGGYWRTRKKYGSAYRLAPVAGDILIEWPTLVAWGGAHMKKSGSNKKPEGGNILFEDGRVEWIPLDKLGPGATYTYNLEASTYYNTVPRIIKTRTRN